MKAEEFSDVSAKRKKPKDSGGMADSNSNSIRPRQDAVPLDLSSKADGSQNQTPVA